MKYVLITGGTSGIGYDLAKKFAEKDYGLIIVSANIENLETAKSNLEKEYQVTVIIMQQDMSCLGAAENIYRRIKEIGISISVLVNNAGFGLVGTADKIDFKQDERMMILNVISATELCKLFLADMYDAKEGKVLNIASTGAFQPGPYTSTYYASKAFVLSFSRAVRYEAKSKGVQVSALCPGATKTRFFEREGIAVPVGAMSSEKVADIAFKGLMKGKEIIIPGLVNKLLRAVPVKIRMMGIAELKSSAMS